MSLREDMRKYEQITGESAEHVPIIKLGAFLDGYEMGLEALERKAILDKIRAEIEQITDTMGVSYNQYVSKIDVLQIIDKYKAESEEEG